MIMRMLKLLTAAFASSCRAFRRESGIVDTTGNVCVRIWK